MPRNGSGVYAPDWVNASPNTTIESGKQNAMVADLVTDANAARPITAGGTGRTTARLLDGTWRFENTADPSKLLALDLSGLTTATTRTITVPDETAVMQTRVATTVDNSIPRHDGTAGKLKASTALIDNAGALSVTTTTVSGSSFANASSTSVATVKIVNDLGNGFEAQAVGSAFATSTRFNTGAGNASFATDRGLSIGTIGAFDMKFYTGGTYRGAWGDSAGYFLVGVTTSVFATAGAGVAIGPDGSISSRRSGTGANSHIIIANNAGATPTQVGSITSTGSATTYNTASDEDWKDFYGPYDPDAAIAIILADPVRKFAWKNSGETAIGWGAQTSYRVSKDLATPGQGSPNDEDYQPWGIDMSRRTPYLWAALTKALQRIDDLEARLNELEGTS